MNLPQPSLVLASTPEMGYVQNMVGDHEDQLREMDCDMARLRLELVELQSLREGFKHSSLIIGFPSSSTFTLSPTPNALVDQMQEMGLTPPPHIIPRLNARLQGQSLHHKLDLPCPLPPSPPLTRSPSPILIPTTTSCPFEGSGPIRSRR